MAHKHKAFSESEQCWSYCVTPDMCAAKPEKQAAHGNIMVREVCACGAERLTEINQRFVNTSGWVEEQS